MSREKQDWIVFFDGAGKEILRFTVRGGFEGEINDTINLLAYEKGIDRSEITFAVCERK